MHLVSSNLVGTRLALADFVEACVRAQLPIPDAVLEMLEHADISAPAARALVERCRGLIATDDDFDRPFAAALRAYDESGMPFARARTALCFGERLRRVGRRVECRRHLRAALDGFTTLGAAPWATRAEQELRATGETVQSRESYDWEQLTPQELQVSLLVAQGATNREAGATLFLSPKTVEYHLGHVYRKLSVRSRTELAHRLGGALAPSLTPT